MGQEPRSKLVHHACGCALMACVVGGVGGEIVVTYRTADERTLLVSHCPLCGRPLRLWWEVEMDALLTRMNVALEAGAWAEVVALAHALYEQAQEAGEMVLAELVFDLYRIAADALATPSLVEQIWRETGEGSAGKRVA